MRLTKSLIDLLVSKIIQDVPKTAYATAYEERVKALAFGLLPKEIRNLPNEILNSFVEKFHYWPGEDGISSFYLKGDSVVEKTLRQKVKEDGLCTELRGKHVAQREKLRALKAELNAAFTACTTDKQFRDKFPEFAKYLPAETETKNLPVVQVVEHLKAAGWKE